MTMLSWSKGQPGPGPVTAKVSRLEMPDGQLYRMRQTNLFGLGGFGFVPVTMIRTEDQIFPDLNRLLMRTVALAGQAFEATDFYIEVEHDPKIEPDRVKDSAYYDPTTRIFARRPTLDQSGAGLRNVVLELPAAALPCADLRPDAEGGQAAGMPPSRALRRAVVLARYARRRAAALTNTLTGP